MLNNNNNKKTTTARYSSITEIQYFLENKKPFLAQHNVDGTLYIKTKSNHYYTLTTTAFGIKKVSNCIFHSLKWNTSNTNDGFCEKDSECLLLPLLKTFVPDCNSNPFLSRYYIITDDWLEFNEHLKPVVPLVDPI